MACSTHQEWPVVITSHIAHCILQMACCAFRGHAFFKAIALARREMASDVVELEVQWAEWLVAQGQLDAAVNHFIEAGQAQKAVDAALEARQYSQAASIMESMVSRQWDQTYSHVKCECLWQVSQAVGQVDCVQR